MTPAADANSSGPRIPPDPSRRLRLLMVGSSIFEQWPNPAAAFPGCEVTNAAVGGTQTTDWIEKLPGCLDQHRPDVLSLYCGSNDLADGRDADRVVDNLCRLRAQLSDHDPAAGMIYFNVIQCPARREMWETVRRVNQRFREALPNGDTVVNTNTIFLDDQLTPPDNTPGMFLDDGVHLTAKGYFILAAHARGELMRHRWPQLDELMHSDFQP